MLEELFSPPPPGRRLPPGVRMDYKRQPPCVERLGGDEWRRAFGFDPPPDAGEDALLQVVATLLSANTEAELEAARAEAARLARVEQEPQRHARDGDFLRQFRDKVEAKPLRSKRGFQWTY